MARATFADPPVSSTSNEPTETSRLKAHAYTPTYSYIDEDLEALAGASDGDDGREVEVWKPGKSGFYQTVSDKDGGWRVCGVVSRPACVSVWCALWWFSNAVSAEAPPGGHGWQMQPKA